MISSETFELTRQEYGWCSSWAVWSSESDSLRPTSGISDLSIFNRTDILDILHVDYIVVGLNISRKLGAPPFENFHSPSSSGKDFKLRHALQGTQVWGAYMTDIIKDHEDKNSQNVLKNLIKDKDILQKNLNIFEEEVEKIHGCNAKFIALGNAVFEILSKKYFGINEIIKVPHYSKYISMSQYREEVIYALDQCT